VLHDDSIRTSTQFQAALEAFVDKLQEDRQVIAAILLGSMSYDQVWAKSDIDLKIIVLDQKLGSGTACFVENDIPINATIQTRDDFKRWLERSIQSSFNHSILVRSTLLFTKDATIAEYMEQIRHIGERDRQLQLMVLGSYALELLAKAEKWLYVKNDIAYSAMWMNKTAELLAQIEVVLHNDVPMREVVQQAIGYNPELFHAIYTELVLQEVHRAKVEAALARVNQYLDQRAEAIFQPILHYLQEEDDVRSVTEITNKFNVIIPTHAGAMAVACDWLAGHGLLSKLESETKATPKSRVVLLEPAYAYESDEMERWMNS